ncbi:MAG TPA: IS1182 family transposase [Gammaproteobacteria bacterium]|nr:IS1182 family transposase [Gammaproteobacteria bacterium]
MSYIRGEDRGQAALLPAAIEDYVAADAPVRVIDAFVDGLDVRELAFGRSVPAATGRPPYDPRDLLKLYLYGYLNEVRSSRRLERECTRNVEVMWLLLRLAPDFKTIADFRRDNGAAIVGACRAFVLFCRDQGLFTARLVALDGSKFRAAASAKRIMGRREIAEEAARLDRRIADYLAGLDESDAGEPDEVPNATAAALEALRTRRAELNSMAAKLDAEERNTLVEGEPDARPMGVGSGRKPPSYNMQTAVDADTGLIVHHEVTGEPNDTRQLYSMAKATKDALETGKLTVVADAGYSNGTDAAACEDDGITPCVPANRAINNQGDGTLFDRSAFVYQPDTDTYRCPAGRTLVRKQIMRRDNCVLYAAQDCSGCALKPRCTTAARRFLTRHFHDDALQRMNARVEADPGLMRQRRCAAEHPFGTIKRMTAGGRFLTRGLTNVKAEAALSILAYNILRAINLIGAPALTARLA